MEQTSATLVSVHPIVGSTHDVSGNTGRSDVSIHLEDVSNNSAEQTGKYIKKGLQFVADGAKHFGGILACAAVGEGVVGPLYERHVNHQKDSAIDGGKLLFLCLVGLALLGVGNLIEKCIPSDIHKEN